jgi:hypothetical protein
MVGRRLATADATVWMTVLGKTKSGLPSVWRL